MIKSTMSPLISPRITLWHICLIVGCCLLSYISQEHKISLIGPKALIHIFFGGIFLYGLCSYLIKYPLLYTVFITCISLDIFSRLAYDSPLSVATLMSSLNAPLSIIYTFFIFNGWAIIQTIAFLAMFLFIRGRIKDKIFHKQALLVGLLYVFVPTIISASVLMSGDSFFYFKLTETAKGADKNQIIINRLLGDMAWRLPAIESLQGVASVISLSLKSADAAENTWTKVSVNKGAADILVLGVGESVRAKNFNLYGYERNTTPHLNGLSDSIAVHKATFAAATNTWNAVPTMFTKMESRDGRLMPNYSQSIVQLAKAAGYKVIWLSNQLQYDVFGRTTFLLATQADERIFISSSKDGHKFDGSLEKKLETIIDGLKTGEKTMIVYHMFGSHMLFKGRYPTTFDQFNADHYEGENASRQAEYDNTILYTDFVLGLTITYLQGKDIPFIYVGDHGLTSPLSDIPYKHDIRLNPSIESLHVPFILSGGNLGLNDLPSVISLYSFECIFSAWSGVSAHELTDRDYCKKSLKNNKIKYLNVDLKLLENPKPTQILTAY